MATMPSRRRGRRRLLRALVGEQRRRLSVASALFVSHQVGEVLVPVVAGLAIDRAVVTGDIGSLARWLVVLALVFAVLSTSWRWAERLLTAAVEDGAHRLRLRLTARLVDDRGVSGPGAVGEVVSVVATDVVTAAQVLVAVAAGVAAVAALGVAAVILLVLSRPLGAVVLLGLPVAVVGLQLLTAPLERRAGQQREDVAQAAGLAADLLAGLRVIKGLRAESAASRRYRRASRRALGAGLRTTRLAAVHDGGTVLVTGVFVALVALVAGRLAADGRMTVGALVAAIGVTQFLVGPLWRLGFAAAELAKARASADRVEALLDADAVLEDGDLLPDIAAQGLALRAVSHGTLAGLDLQVAPGALVALAALDQVDAAAVVELLARGQDPSGGRIEVDGVPLTELSLAWLRRNVLVASHDATLFSGSVADNLATLAPVVAGDSVQLDALLESVGAGDLAHTLADGLDTTVTARGMSLSGGQRQRVALARALAADAPILVLHDPTTAVDPVTEAVAATGLKARRAGRTTVIVATSPALLAVADEVFVIDGGVVVDRGLHSDLLGRDARYATAVLA